MKLSKEILIEENQEKIYLFLSDLRNHEQLVPSELISKWESDTEECSFSLKNLIHVFLKISHKEPHHLLVATPSKETPVPVNLSWEISAIAESQSKVVYTIEAEANMMLEMVAKPIINQLIDHELEQLKLYFSK